MTQYANNTMQTPAGMVVQPNASYMDQNGTVYVNNQPVQQVQQPTQVMPTQPVIQPQQPNPVQQSVQPQNQTQMPNPNQTTQGNFNPQNQPVSQPEPQITQQPVTMNVPQQNFSIGSSETPTETPMQSQPAPTMGTQQPTGPSDAELEKLKAENINLRKARTEEVRGIVQNATGNAENKAILDKWVDDNLSAYEKKAINDIMNTGSLLDVQETMNNLITRFNAGNNLQTPNQNQVAQNPQVPQQFNSTGTPVANPQGTHMSAEQYQMEMTSDRYQRDPNYAAQIDAARQATIKGEMQQGQSFGPFGRR